MFEIPCPECRFSLRIHDASLLGRKGRCPKCHHKFILTPPDEQTSKAPSDLAQPSRSASDGPRLQETTAVEPEPQRLPVSTPEVGSPASALQPSWQDALLRSLSRGISGNRAGAPATAKRRERTVRWVLPGPLQLSTVMAAILGAGVGLALVRFLQGPVSGVLLCLSAAAGGLLAVGCLIRKSRL